MVGIFASLKWRLFTSRIRAARGGAKAGMIIAWCLAGIVVLATAVTLASLRTLPTVAPVAITTLFTAQFVAWGLAPLIAFGVDETVDPARFALLPLRPATLQSGLLVSSLIGYLPLANAIVLVGAAIGLSREWWMLPVALLCAAAQLLLCLLFSRALSAAVSGVMSGRRGRDVGVLLGFAVFVGYMAINYSLQSSRGVNVLGAGATWVSGGLGWLPPGALAQLPGALADGRIIRVLIAAATVLVTGWLLWRWWAVALRASLTSVPSTTENASPGRVLGGLAIASNAGGMARLMMERDRTLAWRDPLRRVSWLMIGFLTLVWPFLIFRGHGALFAVGFPAILAASLASNVYGTDGSGVWLHMVAFADRARARGEVIGHALTALLPAAAVVIAAVVLQAAVHSDWQWLPAALGVCLAGLLGATAVAGYCSARLPFAVRQSRTSMFNNSVAGQKGRTSGASLAMMGGGIVAALPSIGLAVVALLVDPGFGWVGLVVGVGVGLVAIWRLSAVTARTYLERVPEILAAVAVGDRS